MTETTFDFDPLEIAGLIATLSIVLAGFSFLVIAQEIREERAAGEFSPDAFETFGLSFLGLVVVAFLSAVVVGEGEPTERAFMMQAVTAPAVVASILLLTLDSIALLERRLNRPYVEARWLAIGIVFLTAAFFVVTMLDYLGAVDGRGRAVNVALHHQIWIIGLIALTMPLGAIAGYRVDYPWRKLRSRLYVAVIVASGLGIAVLSEAYGSDLPARPAAGIAIVYTVLAAAAIATLLAAHVQAVWRRN